jgi:hypothetical protein
MPKFRKKPVVIEAEQVDLARMTHNRLCELGAEYSPDDGYFIPTLEGNHRISDGDWIITGVKGERYPCKPDIFAMTYEPYEES